MLNKKSKAFILDDERICVENRNRLEGQLKSGEVIYADIYLLNTEMHKCRGCGDYVAIDNKKLCVVYKEKRVYNDKDG
jgi:hypothetical protein